MQSHQLIRLCFGPSSHNTPSVGCTVEILSATAPDLAPILAVQNTPLCLHSAIYWGNRDPHILVAASHGVAVLVTPINMSTSREFIEHHQRCVKGNHGLVATLEDSRELVLVAVGPAETPAFWGFVTFPGVPALTKQLLDNFHLAVIFDLDETLVVANTFKSLEGRLERNRQTLLRWTEGLSGNLSVRDREVRINNIACMEAENALLARDAALILHFTNTTTVKLEDGRVFTPRVESAVLDDGTIVKRPVIRLGDWNVVLTRIDPLNPRTSILIRFRPGWDNLRQVLAGEVDKKKRFDVYVCTAAEREYALEVWRLLDPTGAIIPQEERSRRITNVPAGYNKTLLHALGLADLQDASVQYDPPGAALPSLAMCVDDRVDVWGEADQSHVLQVVPWVYYRDEAAKRAKVNPALAQASEQELVRVRNAIASVRSEVYQALDTVVKPQLARALSGTAHEGHAARPDALPAPLKTAAMVLQDPVWQHAHGMTRQGSPRASPVAAPLPLTVPDQATAERTVKTDSPRQPDDSLRRPALSDVINRFIERGFAADPVPAVVHPAAHPVPHTATARNGQHAVAATAEQKQKQQAKQAGHDKRFKKWQQRQAKQRNGQNVQQQAQHRARQGNQKPWQVASHPAQQRIEKKQRQNQYQSKKAMKRAMYRARQRQRQQQWEEGEEEEEEEEEEEGMEEEYPGQLEALERINHLQRMMDILQQFPDTQQPVQELVGPEMLAEMLQLVQPQPPAQPPKQQQPAQQQQQPAAQALKQQQPVQQQAPAQPPEPQRLVQQQQLPKQLTQQEQWQQAAQLSSSQQQPMQQQQPSQPPKQQQPVQQQQQQQSVQPLKQQHPVQHSAQPELLPEQQHLQQPQVLAASPPLQQQPVHAPALPGQPSNQPQPQLDEASMQPQPQLDQHQLPEHQQPPPSSAAPDVQQPGRPASPVGEQQPDQAAEARWNAVAELLRLPPGTAPDSDALMDGIEKETHGMPHYRVVLVAVLPELLDGTVWVEDGLLVLAACKEKPAQAERIEQYIASYAGSSDIHVQISRLAEELRLHDALHKPDPLPGSSHNLGDQEIKVEQPEPAQPQPAGYTDEPVQEHHRDGTRKRALESAPASGDTGTQGFPVGATETATGPSLQRAASVASPVACPFATLAAAGRSLDAFPAAQPSPAPKRLCV